MNSRNRPIIVLGAQRTGTSLAAYIVHEWGASGGQADKLKNQPGHPANPLGYWEYQPLVTFHQNLIASVPGHAFQDQHREGLRQRARETFWRQQALDLVDEMNRAGKIWFWKWPEFGLALDFWSEVIPEATYIITVRRPTDAANSLRMEWQPAGLGGEVGDTPALLAFWQHNMYMILSHADRWSAKLFVSYENLVQNPREVCQEIAAFLNVQYATSDSDEKVERMVACVDSKYWRNASKTPIEENPYLSDTQASLYRTMLRKTKDANVIVDPLQYALNREQKCQLQNLIAAYKYYNKYAEAKKTLEARSVKLALAFSRSFGRLFAQR